jgi:hypothetical protein
MLDGNPIHSKEVGDTSVSPKLFYNIFVKGAAAVHRSTADSDSG